MQPWNGLFSLSLWSQGANNFIYDAIPFLTLYCRCLDVPPLNERCTTHTHRKSYFRERIPLSRWLRFNFGQPKEENTKIKFH